MKRRDVRQPPARGGGLPASRGEVAGGDAASLEVSQDAGGPRYLKRSRSPAPTLPDTAPRSRLRALEFAGALVPEALRDSVVRYLSTEHLARARALLGLERDVAGAPLPPAAWAQSRRPVSPTLVEPPVPGGLSVRSAEETRGPVAAPASGDPPDVPHPGGRSGWCSEPREPERRRFGSATDPGPATAASEKGNQDFAFHLEIEVPGSATWVLVGVADGVSQATWSARGARHASAAFVEAFMDLSAHPDFPRDEASLGREEWSRVLAGSFHRRVIERMERDRDALLAERRVDPTWAPELFARTFWDGANAARELAKWFQSTLLAVAIGPHGGFALFLGDGFARVDRRTRDGAWQSSPGLDPTRPVSFGLKEHEVFAGLERLPQRGAVEMGVLVTTDGVSKSSAEGKSRAMEGMGCLPVVPDPDEPLTRFAPASSEQCALFLRALAAMPPPLADVDNMSVAFVTRLLDEKGAP